MIAIDTSVIVSIARQEEDARAFNQVLARGRILVGAPTLLEASMVLPRILSDGPARTFLDEFLADLEPDVVAFSRELFQASREAFYRYGRGRGHPAQLNFGDCMSYAVAKSHDAPLLFKGRDFAHTDIRPALA